MTSNTKNGVADATMQSVATVAQQEVESIQATEATEVQVWVEFVDPNEVIIEDNIRSDAKAPAWFVRSVREHGVIVPVLAHPDEGGRIVIRDGQVRTLAAREAGLTAIPAYVVPEGDEAKVRIIQQLVTNDHRTDLSTSDRAEAWHQLALAGMSVTAISRKTGAKPKDVKAGLAVAGFDVAKTVVAQHDLTLEQASVLVEFEGDEDALKTLTETARKQPRQFDHAAQRLRDEREREVARQVLIDEASAAGIAVVPWPSYDDKTIAALGELQDEDGHILTVEDYKNAKPGAPGLVAAIRSGWGKPTLGYFVTDFRKFGLRKVTGSGPAPRKMSEAEKAERKRVVENNKAWDSATKVRIAWLATFLTRKRLPSDAPLFVATVLTRHRHSLAKAVSDGNDVAHTISGVEPGLGSNLYRLVEATSGRAAHVTLAVALGGLESALSRASWRGPSAEAAYYLNQLAEWGYDLSDVERIITDAYARTEPADQGDTEDESGAEVEPDEVEADQETDTDGNVEDAETEHDTEHDTEDVEPEDDGDSEPEVEEFVTTEAEVA